MEEVGGGRAPAVPVLVRRYGGRSSRAWTGEEGRGHTTTPGVEWHTTPPHTTPHTTPHHLARGWREGRPRSSWEEQGGSTRSRRWRRCMRCRSRRRRTAICAGVGETSLSLAPGVSPSTIRLPTNITLVSIMSHNSFFYGSTQVQSVDIGVLGRMQRRQLS